MVNTEKHSRKRKEKKSQACQTLLEKILRNITKVNLMHGHKLKNKKPACFPPRSYGGKKTISLE